MSSSLKPLGSYWNQTWQEYLLDGPLECLCFFVDQNVSSLKPPALLEPNLVGVFIGWSSGKFDTFLAHLVKVHVSFCDSVITWGIELFTFESSPLKQLSQMKRNLVGSIFGKSSRTITHFTPIPQQTWPPQAILVSERSIKKKSLLENRLSKQSKLLQEASMEIPI